MINKILSAEKELNQTNLTENFSSLHPAQSRTISNANVTTPDLHLGVNPLVDVKIVIEGVECKGFNSFHLQQSIQDHHAFVLSLPHHALGERENYQMAQTQELLGKRILARVTYKYGKKEPDRNFIGIITEVSFEQTQGNHGDIILKGYSPTILLDKAPHIQSFGGCESTSLQAIVNQLLNEGYTQNGKYNYFIQSNQQAILSYSCQYNETAYNYLTRIAEAYGAQFFYDGEVLYFGDIPKTETTLSLVYGRDIEQIKVSMSAQHVNREFYGYNSLDNEHLTATGDTTLEVKGTLAKRAYELSQRVFTCPSVQAAPIKATTNQDITQAQKGLIGRVGMSVFTISGTTTNPFLYPGCLVELSMFNALERENHFFTKLMITSISHEIDALGAYKGHFEAVDADTGYIPRGNYQKPIVEQQLATVISNQDPQNKGRVQVQFDWQNVDLKTAFIRVMSPDAGSSTNVDTNRGFVGIPEVGDQVLVGFINQNPDRPFVMGGVFHGQIGAGGGTENSTKSWSTKSGHIIELNDQGGIQIIDKKKNTIQLDGEGVITINSLKAIVLKTGKSSLSLDKSGKISIQGEELNLQGEEIFHVAKDKLKAVSGSASLTLDAGDNEATLSSKSTSIKGTSVVKVNGGIDAKVTAGGTASIEGAIVKLN
ncbi:type VI secretion system Vgr family protein [Myroides fluvii]|uniref:type VI secretion system Vgr family protein n=1 Tax=Myroides fluvii TaxID=2572594 RepID=UPI00131DA060|nr:phage baseplate assembly protein V [Myroides fluvii]